jgi:hypothetical protein
MRDSRTRRSQQIDCWRRFLLLEHRLITALGWVQPDDRNFSCYSRELAALLKDTYPELENAALAFAPDTTGFTPRPGQAIFHAVICHYFPDIHSYSVGLTGYGMRVRPWGAWRASDALPDWWVAAGEVNNRDGDAMQRATLRNALNAVAGLFVLLLLGGARSVTHLSPGNRLLIAGDYVVRDGAHEVLRQAPSLGQTKS